MRIKIERAPDSAWFAYWRATPGVRDLGDFVLWVCGWQFAFFRSDNPWGPPCRK